MEKGSVICFHCDLPINQRDAFGLLWSSGQYKPLHVTCFREYDKARGIWRTYVSERFELIPEGKKQKTLYILGYTLALIIMVLYLSISTPDFSSTNQNYIVMHFALIGLVALAYGLQVFGVIKQVKNSQQTWAAVEEAIADFSESEVST